MSTAELIGVLGACASGLLGLIVALIAVIYRNDREVTKAELAHLETRITALEKQNTEQETKIATLVANQLHAGAIDNRLAQSIDKLDGKMDLLIDVMRELTRKLSLPNMPAVRGPIPR